MGGLVNSTLTRSGGFSMLACNTNVDDCESRGYPCVHGHACRLSHENGHAHVGGCAYASDSLTTRGNGSDCAHACVDANLSWHWLLPKVEVITPSVARNYTTLESPQYPSQASVSSGTSKLLARSAHL